MNIRETMEYVEQMGKNGSIMGLDSIRELLRRIGDPQDALQFVHIAGTNGKGSTLAYISTALTCAGYKTGRYISPTISDYRERFQINGRMISKKDLCGYMERIKAAADSMQEEGLRYPTAFEVETALAFLYMKEKQCDIVLLETGLGGALDATNVITTTIAAVITSVSMDHMAFLGNTLSQIAEQKAGIIKNKCYVITAKQQEQVMEVIERRCTQCGCSLRIADTADVTKVKYGVERQKFSYKECKDITIPLAGQFQIENAVLAIEALRALGDAGYTITSADMRTGLSRTKWHGRFSIISRNPLFIIDGAHNADAARRLDESIRLYFAGKQIVYIMGVLRDKEYDRIIEATYREAAHIITVTPPDNARAMPAYELAMEAQKYHSSVTAAGSLEEAVEMAYLLADKKTVIIAFGSLSYLGALTKVVGKFVLPKSGSMEG